MNAGLGTVSPASRADLVTGPLGDNNLLPVNGAAPLASLEIVPFIGGEKSTYKASFGHFAEGETEAQSRAVTCPRPPRRPAGQLEMEASTTESQSRALTTGPECYFYRPLVHTHAVENVTLSVVESATYTDYGSTNFLPWCLSPALPWRYPSAG